MLRLVVVQGGKHPVYLVSSVLAKKALSDAQVATIHGKRWGTDVGNCSHAKPSTHGWNSTGPWQRCGRRAFMPGCGSTSPQTG